MLTKREFVQYLRSHQTDTEKHLWQLLRNRCFARYKFRRQHRIDNFVVDFVCLRRQLIIELDGTQHREQPDYDVQRSAYLKSLGFQMLRFWNQEILKNTQAVMDKIHQALTDRYCQG